MSPGRSEHQQVAKRLTQQHSLEPCSQKISPDTPASMPREKSRSLAALQDTREYSHPLEYSLRRHYECPPRILHRKIRKEPTKGSSAYYPQGVLESNFHIDLSWDSPFPRFPPNNFPQRSSPRLFRGTSKQNSATSSFSDRPLLPSQCKKLHL